MATATKNFHDHENIQNSDYQITNNKQRGNTIFIMEAVSTIEWIIILKYTCFCLIPYIHSPVMGLFLRISMTIMARFPGPSLITKKDKPG